MKVVFDALISDEDSHNEALFLQHVLNTFDTSDCNKDLELGLNVLESVVEFYKIVTKDRTRNGIVARKLILQAVAGSMVLESSQGCLLSEKLGARRQTLFSELDNRKILEQRQLLVPFMTTLKRKSPHGTKFVSDQTRYDIIAFYEDDSISDILKGHNNLHKEKVISESGEASYFIRPKRVLKIHFWDLLRAAQKQANFQFSLSTLMNLRPPWVRLAREAHALTCLCDRCQNMVLPLRSICNFVNWLNQHGSP